MEKVLTLMLATTALLLAGCNKNTGDQFLGSWNKVSGRGPDLNIEKSGDNFVIKQPDHLITGRTVMFPAALINDGLEMSTGMGTARFVIDKASGHLIAPGEELARASN